MQAQLIRRPWGQFLTGSAAPQPLADAPLALTDVLTLYAPTDVHLSVDGDRHACESRYQLTVNGRSFIASRPPTPMDPDRGFTVALADKASVRLATAGAAMRPHDPPDQNDARQVAGAHVMAVLRRLAARIETVVVDAQDPAGAWAATARRWLDADDDHNPMMDVIVRHARELKQVLVELERAARRILRRDHALEPLGRVHEIDRTALLWFVRQPGRTIAERAGPRQRMLAPIRIESLDTPENRVLRGLCELSDRVARDYLDLNGRAAETERYRRVAAHGKMTRRIGVGLCEAQVRRPDAAMTPNYALQHDPRYHAVWDAWRELLLRRRVEDEMWRWQAESWDEFCVAAIAAACAHVEGAELVAASPLKLRDEHRRGRRLLHDNPIAVFHLTRTGQILTVSDHRFDPGANGRALSAAAWLAVGRIDGGFESRIAVWGLLQGGAAADADAEARSAGAALALAPPSLRIAGGVILRMAPSLETPATWVEAAVGPRRMASAIFGPASSQLAPTVRALGAYIGAFASAAAA